MPGMGAIWRGNAFLNDMLETRIPLQKKETYCARIMYESMNIIATTSCLLRRRQKAVDSVNKWYVYV